MPQRKPILAFVKRGFYNARLTSPLGLPGGLLYAKDDHGPRYR
jgi:hypothetical protein